MSATIPLNPLNLQTLSDKIEWQYFFGGQATTTTGQVKHTRFYFATVNGLRVEKRWSSPNKHSYTIGNYDKAKKKYRTEQELIDALSAGE